MAVIRMSDSAVSETGPVADLVQAALRLERLGRELQEAGSRLHSAMETATSHIHRGQSRRVTRNRDLWKHWAVQPLYGVSPLAGQGGEMLAKRRRMEREATE